MFNQKFHTADINLYASKTEETAIYPGADGREDEIVVPSDLAAILYCTLGLVGEAGEVANKVKKILRDDDFEISDEKRQAILAEVGDVGWYFVQLILRLGGNPGEVISANYNKLLDRKNRDVLTGSGDER